MTLTFCRHVYENVGEYICPYCGKNTHEINWEEQNNFNKKWREENPDAKYGGWWSI